MTKRTLIYLVSEHPHGIVEKVNEYLAAIEEHANPIQDVQIVSVELVGGYTRVYLLIIEND